MRLALGQARLAAAAGEVPVGTVIIAPSGEVLSQAHNRCEAEKLPTAHAEMLAIAAACRSIGDWRLTGCTLYVTLEPCPMCMGAILHARVGRVVFGAPDARAGACGSLLRLQDYPLESQPQITRDVLREDCLRLLRDFFAARRGTPARKRARADGMPTDRRSAAAVSGQTDPTETD